MKKLKKVKKTKCSKYVKKIITMYPYLNYSDLRIFLAQAWQAGYNARKREEKK